MHDPEHSQESTAWEKFLPAAERAADFALRRFGVRPPDADDLRQEIILRVLQSSNLWRGESRFRSYAQTVAHRYILNSLRSKHAEMRSAETVPLDPWDFDTLPAQAHSPLDTVLKREAKQRLRTAIDELPPRMQRCLRLRIYDDLGMHEIAAVLRVQPGTVKALLHQGRQRLREILEADELIAHTDDAK